MTFFWGFVVGREQFASVALSAAALKAASQIRLFFQHPEKTRICEADAGWRSKLQPARAQC